jgi:phosphoglycolate phosphatase-like HAD superfamily hydrolase
MKKVIFDVDGVLLSEKRYFDVSALAVWEWYFSPLYMHLGNEVIKEIVSDGEIAGLRDRFWQHDELLSWMKSHGVNSNWDMVHAHIVTTLWLLIQQYNRQYGKFELLPLRTNEDVIRLGDKLRGIPLPAASEVLQRLTDVVPATANKDEVFIYLTQAVVQDIGDTAQKWAPLGSPLWKLHFECFQEWYFGDALYEQAYGKKPYAPGKPGFLRNEEPLGTAQGIKRMFRELKTRGYEIAIATGRTMTEMQIPFETFGWFEEFDPLYISTDTDVAAAEQQLGQSLDKPNPFVYYMGAFGKKPELYKDYINNPEKYKNGKYYVVGDSLADVWCAKAMGAAMIGTLTGLEGPAARPMFEENGADYIVDSVEGILSILK